MIYWKITIEWIEEEYTKQDDINDQYTREKVHVILDGKSSKFNNKMDEDDKKDHDKSNGNERKLFSLS